MQIILIDFSSIKMSLHTKSLSEPMSIVVNGISMHFIAPRQINFIYNLIGTEYMSIVTDDYICFTYNT